jgi:O-antigen/teichoic acid export membrane protein
MSDTSLSRFISNVFSSGLGRFFIVVFGVFCTIIYARWMPQDEYGGFVLLQILVSLGLTFGSFGMESVITRFIAATEDEEERQKIVNTGLLFILSCLSLTCILIFIFQDFFSQLLSGYIPKNLLVYVPILLLLEGTLSIFSFSLEGKQKFNILARMNFIYGLFSLILTILFVIYLKLGALGLVWARLIPEIITCTISILSVKVKINFRFDTEIFRKMFKFSIPLYGNNLLAFTYSRVDTIIIGIFFGPAQIAIYDFARRIPDSLEILFTAFNSAYFPYLTNIFTGGNKERTARTINYANRAICLIGGLLVLSAYGFGEWGFRLLFSEKYLVSVPAFNLLMIVLIFRVLDSNLGYSLIAIGQSDKPFFLNVIRFVIVFASYFLLIPRFGIIGAVLSSLIGLAAVNPLNAYCLQRQSIKIIMSEYMKPLLLMLLGCIPFYFLEYDLPLSFFIILLFCGACYLWNVLRIEDIKIIRDEVFRFIAKFKRGAPA